MDSREEPIVIPKSTPNQEPKPSSNPPRLTAHDVAEIEDKLPQPPQDSDIPQMVLDEEAAIERGLAKIARLPPWAPNVPQVVLDEEAAMEEASRLVRQDRQAQQQQSQPPQPAVTPPAAPETPQI